MKRHFSNYASAYLAGAFYFLLQFALAFVAVGKGATPDLRANWHRFEWMMFRAQVLVMALPTILAFLDRSVANGRMAAAMPAKKDPAPVSIATSFYGPPDGLRVMTPQEKTDYNSGFSSARGGALPPDSPSAFFKRGYEHGLDAMHDPIPAELDGLTPVGPA